MELLYTQQHSNSTRFVDNVQYNINKIQEIKNIVKSGDLPYINTSLTECINLIYYMIKDDKSYSVN